MGSFLLNLYQSSYVSVGGQVEDIKDYTLQNLVIKIETKFSNTVKKAKLRETKGTFLFPITLSEDEAVLQITSQKKSHDLVQSAAMALRTEIFNIEPQKTPSPTLIHLLKKQAPEIPELLMLFFNTLIKGQGLRNEENIESLNRKSTAMASDAIFNCTRGSVRPWKHQALGLGMGTLSGSKTVIQMLNRLGHSISYDETKRLETEMAYSCSSDGGDTPAGLTNSPDLATGNT